MDEGTSERAAVATGRVLDAAGVPVPRATVHAFEEGVRWFTEMQLLAFGVADDEGRFRFEAPSGPVLLVAAGPEDLLHSPEAAETVHGSRLVLPAVGAPTEIDLRLPFALAHLCRVQGVVRNADGNGVPGISVLIDGVSLRTGVRKGFTTDAQGRFTIDRVLPGERTLETQGTRRFGPVTVPLHLDPGATANTSLEVVARARPGSRRVTVRCVDEAGAPLPGSRVLISADGGIEERVDVGADGRVLIEGLPEATRDAVVHIRAWHRDRAWAHHEIAPPDRPWTDEVTLTLPPRPTRPEEPPRRQRRFAATAPEPDAVVSGVVVDAAGVPVPEAVVTWSPVGEDASPPEWSLHVHRIGQTDSVGRFLLRGLPGGPAILGADFRNATCLRYCPAPMPTVELPLVAGRETTGVELRLPFALADLAVVECRVVDDEGRPRPGVTALVDHCIGSLGPGLSDGTDADGVVRLRVFPGLCDAHAWETATHEGVHVPVEVAPGSTVRVELRTPARTGSATLALMVRVEDESGASVADANIHLSNEEGGVGEARSGPDGTCRFAALPEGLRRSDLEVYAYADGFFIGTPGATVKAWPESGEAEVRLVLRRPVHFRYRVVDDRTGGAVPFHQVECRGTLLQSLHSGSGWDAEPGPREDGLPGPLRIRASAPGYDVAEVRGELACGQPEPCFEIRMKRSSG